MRFLSLAIVFSLSLLTNTGCGRDDDDPQETVAEKPVSSSEGDAVDESNFSASTPSLTTCFKGDTWTCTVEAAILKETNLLRTKPLIQDFESSFVAREWSNAQALAGAISHDGFPKKRKEALIAAFPGQAWSFYAENVAKAQASDPDATKIAVRFVTMWKNSEGHLRNMLGNYRYMGVGVVRVGNTFYATQIFH